MSLSPTTTKLMQIIQLLSNYPHGLTLSEIAAKLPIPKTSIYDIVQTLYKQDWLVYKNERIKNYAIGPKLYIYGATYLKSSNLLNIAQGYLVKFAESYGKTVFVTKRVEAKISYVYKYEAINTKIKTSGIGDQNFLHSTAAGKCFLAFEANVDYLYDLIDLPKLTNYTITSLEELKKNVNDSKEKGFCIDFRESQNHIVCVAAPLYDINRQVIGCVSSSGLYDEKENYHLLGNELAETAKIISEQLGYIES